MALRLGGSFVIMMQSGGIYTLVSFTDSHFAVKICEVNIQLNCDPPSPAWRYCPTRAVASSFLRFLDHTQRLITVDRTPLDAWSVCHRDLYLTTHNTHNRHTSMPPVGFEPTVSAGERPWTCALDRAATGTGKLWLSVQYISKILFFFSKETYQAVP